MLLILIILFDFQLRSKCAPMPVEYVPAWHWMQAKEPDAPVTTYSLHLVKQHQMYVGYERKWPSA